MAVGWRNQYYKYREFSVNLLTIYRQRSDLQAFLEIILSLTTLVIFIVFALKPTILTMVSLTQEINNKKATLTTLNQKISDLQKANSAYLQIQQFLPAIDMAIPQSPSPDTFSKQILALAQKNSVTILAISVDKTVLLGKALTASSDTATSLKPLPQNAQAMPVSANVKGTYPQLIAFLKDLESLRIPIRFDDSVISTAKELTGQTLTELIIGRTPYLGK